MKKYIISFAALTLIQIATFAVGEKLIVKVEKAQGANALQVQLANMEKLVTEVSIQDFEGKVWYSNFVRKQDGYNEKLILDGMPDGNYLLYVKNKSKLKAQAFTTCSGAISLFEMPDSKQENEVKSIQVANPEKQKAKLIARFTNAGNASMKVQLANLNKQPATISLVAIGGGYLLEQKIDNQIGYANNLNLKDVESGNYFLVVEADGATAVQLFRLEKNESLEFGTLQRLEHRPIDSFANGSLTGK